MPDVFISYHEKSAAELAPRIARALQDAGISCWYAPPEKPLTVPFTEEIVRELEDCKVFLLILNEKAVHSVRVATETALAVRGFDDGKKRKLIAFRTDNCDVSADSRMSAFLNKFRIVDGCPPNEANIGTLTIRILLTLKSRTKAKARIGKVPVAAKKTPVAAKKTPGTHAKGKRTRTDLQYVLNKRGTMAPKKTRNTISVKIALKKV